MYPAIFGLEGKRLSGFERAFLKEAQPFGVILFARNVETPDQVRRLTDEAREAIGHGDVVVFIDQEGGRVQRLKPPHWRQAPAMALFGKAYEKNPTLAEKALYMNVQLLALELSHAGIDADCLPVLDVPVVGADNIIGDRAFGSDPEVVAHLGRIACGALRSKIVYPVIKHVPGHGRALADSHKTLPVVDTSLEDLEGSDFVPFKALCHESFAMTAHVTYSAIDPDNPATLSKTVIRDVIRGSIGFQGLLISDDITMKALKGGLDQIAAKCLAAGIDLVLHCSGDLNEMETVMKGLSKMPAATAAKIRSEANRNEGVFADDYFELLPKYQALERELKGLLSYG